MNYEQEVNWSYIIQICVYNFPNNEGVFRFSHSRTECNFLKSAEVKN